MKIYCLTRPLNNPRPSPKARRGGETSPYVCTTILYNVLSTVYHIPFTYVFYTIELTIELYARGTELWFKSDLIGDIEQFLNIFLIQKCCEHTGYGLVLNS